MNITSSRCIGVLAGMLVIGASLVAVATLAGCSSIDAQFGQDGWVITHIGASSRARAVVVQPDGKIVVAGGAAKATPHDFAVARYLQDGSLDPSFGKEGIVITSFGVDVWPHSAAIDRNGRIVIGGVRWPGSDVGTYLARYNKDGSLDSSFGTEGKVVTSIAKGESMAVQGDGKVVVAGQSAENLVLVRYNEDGT